MQQTLTYPARPRRRLVAGLVISILLHMLVLAVWRTPSLPPQPDAQRWAEPIAIRILPQPVPPPAPAPKPRPDPIAHADRQARADRPATRSTRPSPPDRITPEREPDSAVPAMTVVPAQPAGPAPAEHVPRFDPDAARAAARGMANDLNPSTNWAAEKLNKGKEWKETKEERLGRNVENSVRSDCRTAYAGAGLLAPLIMLMDKKDSGCKW